MATNNNRALWDLTRGQRRRMLAALVALIGAPLLTYVGPQFVRLAVDGILDKRTDPRQLPSWIAQALVTFDATNHPKRALILAGCAVAIVTLIAGVLMYFK